MAEIDLTVSVEKLCELLSETDSVNIKVIAEFDPGQAQVNNYDGFGTPGIPPTWDINEIRISVYHKKDLEAMLFQKLEEYRKQGEEEHLIERGLV